MFEKKFYKNIKGFTLIELLIVIAIIGILVTIVVIAVNPTRLLGESRDTKKREELLQLKNTLQLYYNDTKTYPTAANLATALVPNYTRALPSSYMYSGPTENNVPAGEYRAAAILTYPSDSSNNNDQNTRTKCNQPANSLPTGTIGGNNWDDADYFICPD